MGLVTVTVETEEDKAYGVFSAAYGKNYAMASSAVVTVGGRTFGFQSDLSSTDSMRTPEAVATAAYNDRSPVKTGEYAYLTADGNYSPYNGAALNRLSAMKDAQ